MTTPVPTQTKNWVLKNPVVVISALSIVVAGMKVLVVSQGNAEVLKTLVQTLNIPSLVTATILPIMPNILIIALLMIADDQFSKPKDKRITHSEWLTTPILLIALSLTLFVPILLLATYVLLFIFIQAKRYSARRRGMILAGVSFAQMIYYPLFLAIVSGSSVWLPQENVALEKEEVQSAYVLASDVRWTTLMYYKGTVDTVPTPTIVSRQPCDRANPNSIIGATLLSFVQDDRSSLPKCVDPESTQSSTLEIQEGSERMSTSTLWWIIGAVTLGIISVIISTFAWIRAGTTESRDKKVWRLAQLQQDVAAFLQASEERNALCQTEGDAFKGTQSEAMQKQFDILSLLEKKIKFADDGKITKNVSTTFGLHQNSNNAFQQISDGYIETKNGAKVQTLSEARLTTLQGYALIDQRALKAMHGATIMETRNELGLSPNSEDLVSPVFSNSKEENPEKDSEQNKSKSEQSN